MNSKRDNVANVPVVRRWASRLAGLATILLVSGWFGLVAAQSVEKAITSQQAKHSEDELQLAREAVAKKAGAPKPSGEGVGRIVGNYSILTSLEVGYRWVDQNGSLPTYLSDVNVRQGFRVFDYSMDMRSLDGKGALFDFLRMDVQNAGGDQGQYFSFRADKTRAYKFDANVRRFNYWKSQPTYALNQHNFDLRQQVSDFNLKLFPQRKFRVNLYYGRSMAKGPYVTTYDYERDEFPINGRSRWEANDFRFGFDTSIKKWDIFFEQMFRLYRDDGMEDITSLQKGNSTTNLSVLNSFIREFPTRSRASVSRLSVSGTIGERAHVVLRGLYGNENSDLSEFEQTSGVDFSGNKIVSRTLVDNAHVHRPSATLDGVLTFDIGKGFSVSNSFRFFNYRIAGGLNTANRSILQPPTGSPRDTLTNTRVNEFIGVATFWDTIQLNYSTSPKFSFNVGARAQYRDVTLRDNTNPAEKEQDTTWAFLAGVRIRPVKQASFFVDYEDGRANNTFVNIDPQEYRRFRVRTNLKFTDKLTFNASLATTDRTNPTRFLRNDSNARVASFAAFWEPTSRFWFSGGYDFNYLSSNASIIFFLNNVRQTGRSRYFWRQNFMFFDARVGLTKRLDLLLAYRFTKDLGAPPDAKSLGPNDFVTALPLTRHNPEVRLAYRFTDHITGNFMYRHYSYNERDRLIQDYRANIIATTVRFTF
ncbi:MAG: hypothetical protein K1Y36_15915 [Blastocatellia bacterium]|nr:hypothetical protein [Blastocatellia bacterium]